MIFPAAVLCSRPIRRMGRQRRQEREALVRLVSNNNKTQRHKDKDLPKANPPSTVPQDGSDDF